MSMMGTREYIQMKKDESHDVNIRTSIRLKEDVIYGVQFFQQSFTVLVVFLKLCLCNVDSVRRLSKTGITGVSEPSGRKMPSFIFFMDTKRLIFLCIFCDIATNISRTLKYDLTFYYDRANLWTQKILLKAEYVSTSSSFFNAHMPSSNLKSKNASS